MSSRHARRPGGQHARERRSPLALAVARRKQWRTSRNAPNGVARRRRSPAYRRFWWRLPLAIWVAGIFLVVGTGTAVAYFTATGAGIGHITVTQTAPAVVEPATGTPPATKELSPGHSADLRLTLTNSNSYQVQVTGVTQDGSISVVGGSGGCTVSSAGVSVSPSAAALASPIALPPGTHTITVSTGATMASTSSTTCQGASFHIPVDVTVRS